MTTEKLIEQLEGQCAAWEETAAQEARNRDYYRSLVVRIGNLFGHAAHVQDDGGVVEDVLCAKVPELVERLQRENEALRAEHEAIEARRTGNAPSASRR